MRVFIGLITDGSAVGNTYTLAVTETGRCFDFALSANELETLAAWKGVADGELRHALFGKHKAHAHRIGGS